MWMPLKTHGVWLMAPVVNKAKKKKKKKKKSLTREIIEKIYKYYAVTK